MLRKYYCNNNNNNNLQMKINFFSIVLSFFCFSTCSYSQDINHQMFSAQGTSKTLPNGMYISQTIGQQSVIGNYTNNNYNFGQGFQQSVWSMYINNKSNTSISTITYPNPFVSTLNFQFSQIIKETISISLFDIRGRLVFFKNKQANDTILTIELPNLASSNYLVYLSTKNFNYYTKILKQ